MPETAPEEIIRTLRAQFPLLQQQPLCYLDNAATTQKPQTVIAAFARYYSTLNANVHRGAHQLSDQATSAYEQARGKLQRYINAELWQEIIWTRGTTESVNLVASSWGKNNLGPGDSLLISAMEHHANIVPWQQLCRQTGAELKVVPLTQDGELDLIAYQQLLDENNVKLVAVTHISNVLGTLNPIQKITHLAHAHQALVFIDGAQGFAHELIDVQEIGCDFYAASAHKAYGPTGLGFLYGRKAVLETMPPWQFGGEMIRTVSFDHTEFNELPFCFEAGTPAIAEVIAFSAALDFLTQPGMKAWRAYEQQRLQQLYRGINSIKGAHTIGPDSNRRGLVSFTLEGQHCFDVGQALNQHHIAIRTGHHCAMPLMDYLGLPDGCARASLAVYNNKAEIDLLLNRLETIAQGETIVVGTQAEPAKDSSSLLAEIAQIHDWQQKLNRLMQWSQHSPNCQLNEAEKQAENQLHGCTSKVWMLCHWHGETSQLSFQLDANSKIIKSLAAVLLELVNGQTPQTILAIDFEAKLQELGLSQHLSPSRNNGLHAIAEAIKSYARHYQTEG